MPITVDITRPPCQGGALPFPAALCSARQRRAENLDFVARLYELPDRRVAVRDALKRMELSNRSGQLAQELSGGWKQRLALAACVMHQPRLLLLDEPTAGVDALARREFWDLITDMAASGMTVLVSTHYMDEAERCQRIVYLAGGKLIVDGTAEAVVKDAALVVFEAGGVHLADLAKRARATKGLESATIIGRKLRIVGTDRAAVLRAVGNLEEPGVQWEEAPAQLDDVFIHLLSDEHQGG